MSNKIETFMKLKDDPKFRNWGRIILYELHKENINVDDIFRWLNSMHLHELKYIPLYKFRFPCNIKKLKNKFDFWEGTTYFEEESYTSAVNIYEGIIMIISYKTETDYINIFSILEFLRLNYELVENWIYELEEELNL